MHGGLRFSRVLRGVEEVRTLEQSALRSAEARKLAALTDGLQEVYQQPAKLIRKDNPHWLDLFEAINA